VFSPFKGPLAELERRLTEAGIKVARYDGDTPQWKRDEIEIDFDRKFCDQPGYEKKYQVLLANYKTGGTGLNFTGATETIILDEEWNPGKADQAFGRTDRLGQIKETRVTILRLKDSIDDWMVALNQQKAEMIAGFEESTVNLADELLNAMKGGTVQ
jgi:SNF2 family DNA or RNA helicase